MTWMRVTIPSTNIARRERLFGAFEGFFLAIGAPAGAAMFESNPTFDEFVLYFSPDAVSIFSAVLAGYSPIECDAPPRSGTTPLIGRAEAKDMLGPKDGGE
jgi:hypothetical protein